MTQPHAALPRPGRTSHLVVPTVVFLALAGFGAVTPLDFRLASLIYGLGNNTWQWRDAWVTSNLIHDGGRQLVAVIALLLLGVMAGSIHPQLRPHRRGLVYVLASAIVSALLVNLLKRVTAMDCPWDLVRFGGDRVYHGLLEGRAETSGKCFPAGHASAGYAWFGAYFFARACFPRWRLPILGGVMALGLIFGIGQQVRGAHFFSHDVWTAWLCWIVAYTGQRLVFPCKTNNKEPSSPDSVQRR